MVNYYKGTMASNDKVICPQCSTQLSEPNQSYCYRCGCFVLHRQYEELFKKLEASAPGFVARMELVTKKSNKAKELAERLKARKRVLVNLVTTQKITEDQLVELQHIDEHIKKFDRSHGTGDVDMPAVGKALQAFSDELAKGNKQGALARALGVFAEEADKAEEKALPEPTEAEKKRQQFEVALGKHEAPKQPIKEHIRELEVEEFKLEKSLEHLNQMEDPPEPIQLSIKDCKTKLGQIKDEIVAYKQKLKSMSG